VGWGGSWVAAVAAAVGCGVGLVELPAQVLGAAAVHLGRKPNRTPPAGRRVPCVYTSVLTRDFQLASPGPCLLVVGVLVVMGGSPRKWCMEAAPLWEEYPLFESIGGEGAVIGIEFDTDGSSSE